MAGLIIISRNAPPANNSIPANTVNITETTNHNNSTDTKIFLKKAFLLAKHNGKYLMQAASQTGSTYSALFATISFLGGSFGFGDENIYNPLQGGLTGLTKTAAIEWDGVLCRAIDLSYNQTSAITPLDAPDIPDLIDILDPLDIIDVKMAISLILTRHCPNSPLYGAVEIGIKDRFCLIPEVVPEILTTSIPYYSIPPYHILLNSKDVVVITGGAKGVTAECAVELASRFSSVIILIGRSPLPEPEPAWLNGMSSEADIKKAILANMTKSHVNSPPTPAELQKIYRNIASNSEIRENLERISDAGSIVKYYSVDIRNMAELSAILADVRDSFGKISGIIHGAGILEDKLIVDKTESQFSAVFETKVSGMENLLNTTLHNPNIHDELKFVVFFSSVAARSGNAGQVDYAMANEVLNKTAQYYTKLRNGKNSVDNLYDSNGYDDKSSTDNNIGKCKFLSINWGPWEGGMVSPSLKNAFMKRGIDLIPLKQGAESFVDELCQCLSETEPYEVEVVIGASLFKEIKPDHDLNTSDSKTIDLKTDMKKTDITIRQALPVLFSREKILAFAVGNPSEAFGEKYSEFDTQREIARLPGPPYFFMDRVIKADAKPWEMVPSGWIEAQFDMPCDGWYFRAGHTDYLPFCILLEIALQPCGWLAAYTGSALKSKDRLFFRNLGGEAQIFKPVKRFKSEHIFITLTMRSKMTSVSHAGGMIIQNFDMEVLSGNDYIYKGKTNFGFFTAQSFANQAGIKKSTLHYTPEEEYTFTVSDPYVGSDTGIYPLDIKAHKPLTPEDVIEDTDLNITDGMPAKALCMVDTIDLLLPDGGKYGKGFIKGSKKVNPDEWFFKAHFYQDPVCPGSLGVESFLQIIRFYALKLWKYNPSTHDLVLSPHTHKWIYRGQIVPSCGKIEVCAHIKDTVTYTKDKHNGCTTKDYDNSNPVNGDKNGKITADGLLYVDGLCIYQMEDFTMELVKKELR